MFRHHTPLLPILLCSQLLCSFFSEELLLGCLIFFIAMTMALVQTGPGTPMRMICEISTSNIRAPHTATEADNLTRIFFLPLLNDLSHLVYWNL